MNTYIIVLWSLGMFGLIVNVISVYLILKSLKYLGDQFKGVLKFLTISIVGFSALAVDLGLLVTYRIDYNDPIWISNLILAFFASGFFFLGARKLLSLMKKVKIK